MIKYKIPENVSHVNINNRPALRTPQGGLVALDNSLLSLWQFADGRTFHEVTHTFRLEDSLPFIIQSGLACLAEAGLLNREGLQEKTQVTTQYIQGPPVSAVIVSYDSRKWLQECIPSLIEQTYSPLEIIVVDNGSQDDSIAWVQNQYPSVICHQIEEAVSLARAINLGIEIASQADYYLIINPDIRLDSDAVAQMVSVAQSDAQCAAVAAKLRFWWAPEFLNGIGNRVGPFSWGTDNALGHLDLGQFDDWQEVPSACFAATLISKKAWHMVGQIDDKFPLYYEDTEWCYRARILGFKVLAAPKADIYHAFGGKVPDGRPDTLSPRKLRSVTYGRLRFTFKIVGEYFPRFLRNYALEDWINFSMSVAKRDWNSSRAYFTGWFDMLKHLTSLLRESRTLQAHRIISDEELFDIQTDMPETFAWNGLPELTWDLIRNHYSPMIISRRTKIMPEFEASDRSPHLLIVSNDVVDEKMAGPGMRYLEMARALSSNDLAVTLAIPNETSLKIPNLNFVRYWEERPGSLQVLVDNCDIALISGYMVEKFPFLKTTLTRLVVDLYDPTILENLHYYLNEPIEFQKSINQHGILITNSIASLGDFFICGNERQRDFWLGLLAANERINPLTFNQDPSMRSLIDVVGIGFPDRELQPAGKFIRGIHPAIPEDAQIVLWGGGIWNWLDPLTIIQAWPQVIENHPKARLVFLGTRHPNPLVPVHEMAAKAQKLATEIDEIDRSIIFIEWVPYQERETLLNDADIGVSLHPIHVETRYSIRTRVLDYIWAKLPVLATQGDITSEWIEQYNIGEVVPPFDVAAVASALNILLQRPKSEWRDSFDPLLTRFRWSNVVEPLRRYCITGSYASDREQRDPQIVFAPMIYNRWSRAVYIWRTEGIRAMIHRSLRYIQWRLSRP